MGILAGDAIGELVHVRLAEEDRSRARELRGNVAVLVRHEIAENLRTRRRPDAARREVVFERNRNAVERPAPTPAAKLALRGPRLATGRVGKNRQESIDGRIPPLDLRERRVHKLHRRNLAPPQQVRGLLDGEKRQFGFGARGHAFPRRSFPAAAGCRPIRDSQCERRCCIGSRFESCRTKSGGTRTPVRNSRRCRSLPQSGFERPAG